MGYNFGPTKQEPRIHTVSDALPWCKTSKHPTHSRSLGFPQKNENCLLTIHTGYYYVEDVLTPGRIKK